MIYRFFVKVFCRISMYPLRFIEFFNPRLYMKIFNGILKIAGVNFVGEPRYIASTVYFDDFSKIVLSGRTVISSNVVLLTHDYSITALKIAHGEILKSDCAVIKGIVLGENVFVGMNSMLLPGTVVGDNVIIGAGSICRGNIPSNTLVLGNPAKVVCSLDELYKKWAVANPNDSLRYD
jgi:acetyltransferase-like isoleucine patch superfamily enzyme